MEMHRINPKSEEGFDQYILALPVDDYEAMHDFASLEVDGKKYVFCLNDNSIAFVENDNGLLNPYHVDLNKNREIKYIYDEKNEYVFDHPEIDFYCCKSDLDTGNIYALGYLKKGNQVDVMEYRQFINDYMTSIIYRYELISRKDIVSALNYANQQLPTQLSVHQDKGKFIVREKVDFYVLDSEKESYLKARFVTKSKYHFITGSIYDGKKLINNIVLNFKATEKIDDDLQRVALGTNENVNKVRKLVNTYQSFIKGQN